MTRLSLGEYLPPWVPILIAAFIHHHRFLLSPSKEKNDQYKQTSYLMLLIEYFIPTILLYLLSESLSSKVYLFRPMVAILRQWPHMIMNKKKIKKYFPNWGPLGFGYSKCCEVICAWCLLVFFDSKKNKTTMTNKKNKITHLLPEAFNLGPLPSLKTISFVLILSFIVNQILSLWSKRLRSRGNHEGVNAMVHKSLGRSLTLQERIHILYFAFLNASCEELVSRGYFMYEFIHVGQISKGFANFGQALAFGIWHYHGIPSGWTGVFLAFVYGWIMGYLMELCGGLFVPIFAHSIADYYIFSVIVRQKDLNA